MLPPLLLLSALAGCRESLTQVVVVLQSDLVIPTETDGMQTAVMDGPLPHSPGAQPKAEAPGTPRVAKVEVKDESEHLSARTHSASSARKAEGEPAPAAKPAARVRVASIERLSVSVDSDAQVLHEREVWLRAIDSKYRITH